MQFLFVRTFDPQTKTAALAVPRTGKSMLRLATQIFLWFTSSIAKGRYCTWEIPRGFLETLETTPLKPPTYMDYTRL